MINILGLLKRLEWQDGTCPVCREHQGQAHESDCLLGAAIRQLEAEGATIREGAYRVLAGMGLA